MTALAKLRLGIYIPVFDPSPHGVGVYIDEVCSRLAARAPTTLFTDGLGPLPEWTGSLVVLSPEVRLRVLRDGARVGRRLARLLFLHLQVRRELKQRGVDVLFCPAQDGLIAPPVPQVLVVHDLTALHTRQAQPVMTATYQGSVVRAVAVSSQLVVAVSQSTARDVRHHFRVPENRLRVVYEGFDRAHFFPASSDAIDAVRARYQLPTKFFLYAGTYSPHKNLDTLICGLQNLDSASPEWVLALAGRTDSGDFAAFLSACDAAGIVDRVRPLGYVPTSDLACLMSACSAFVFPSLYEGFGLSVLEAMACGAYVIASNRASIPEVVGDAGVLLDPQDVSAWRNALSVCLVGTDSVLALKEAARRRSLTFSWDATVDQIAELLEELLGQPAG